MKASELRIGNLVNYHITDIIDERKEWDEPMFIDASDIGVLSQWKTEKYTPIPLTEEWLKRFGFTKEPDADFFFCKQTKMKDVTLDVCIEDGRVILFDNKKQTYVDMKYTESVHSLQNLYFAVTGEELPINNIEE
jgi:hypothetical protein